MCLRIFSFATTMGCYKLLVFMHIVSNNTQYWHRTWESIYHTVAQPKQVEFAFVVPMLFYLILCNSCNGLLVEASYSYSHSVIYSGHKMWWCCGVCSITFVQVPILYVTKGTMYLCTLSSLCTHVLIRGMSYYLPHVEWRLRLKIVDYADIRLDPRRSKAANGTSFELIVLFVVKSLNM